MQILSMKHLEMLLMYISHKHGTVYTFLILKYNIMLPFQTHFHLSLLLFSFISFSLINMHLTQLILYNCMLHLCFQMYFFSDKHLIQGYSPHSTILVPNIHHMLYFFHTLCDKGGQILLKNESKRFVFLRFKHKSKCSISHKLYSYLYVFHYQSKIN